MNTHLSRKKIRKKRRGSESESQKHTNVFTPARPSHVELDCTCVISGQVSILFIFNSFEFKFTGLNGKEKTHTFFELSNYREVMNKSTEAAREGFVQQSLESIELAKNTNEEIL